MKRKRLKALIAEIEADRSRYNQGNWTNLISYYSSWDDSLSKYVAPKTKIKKKQLINCGTTGCIAGLAAFRYAPVGTEFWREELKLPGALMNEYYSVYGKEVLGLTYDEGEYLFHYARTWEEILAFSDMNSEQRRELVG